MFRRFISNLRLKIADTTSPISLAIIGKEQPTHDEINKFILELSNKKDFNKCLRKLIPTHKIKTRTLKELKRDYLSINTNIPIMSYFGDDLAQFGIHELATNTVELNAQIRNNTILKSKCEKLVGFINKHKRLTAGTLTLGGIAGYLFAAAEEVSGCYKFQILSSSERRLLCKVKSCNEDTASINDVLCEDKCVHNLKNCLHSTCNVLSGPLYEFRCVTFKWYDILAKLIRKIEISDFVLYIKYFLVFIVALLSFSFTNMVDIIPRCFISASVGVLTYSFIV